MKIHVNKTERNMFFGHSGSWEQRMITPDLHHQYADKLILSGHPNTRRSDSEKKFIQDYFLPESQKSLVRISEATDFLNRLGWQIDGFWVYSFVEHNTTMLPFHQDRILEKEQHSLSEMARKATSMPSPFICTQSRSCSWEMRIRARRQTREAGSIKGHRGKANTTVISNRLGIELNCFGHLETSRRQLRLSIRPPAGVQMEASQ
jgi:hypothetical protein